MNPPTSAKFSNLEVPVHKLRPERITVIPSEWTRVVFELPDSYTAPQAVMEWLAENVTSQYASYQYTDPVDASKTKMVVRFKDRNDAMMFKLRDGHRAWEHTNA